MRPTGAAFIEAKNKETKLPIWLYRVAVTTNPVNDLFFAEYDQNVPYFRDTATPQVYTSFPIKHAGISESGNGQIDSIRVNVSNVSQLIQTYMESYKGLRDRKVTIRLVWADHLDDPTAHVEFVQTIDSASLNEQTVSFVLKGGTDLLRIGLPRRRFLRDICQWTYKGWRCWKNVAGVYETPTGFDDTSPDSCERIMDECIRHNNVSRFGSYPGVPSCRYRRD